MAYLELEDGFIIGSAFHFHVIEEDGRSITPDPFFYSSSFSIGE